MQVTQVKVHLQMDLTANGCIARAYFLLSPGLGFSPRVPQLLMSLAGANLGVKEIHLNVSWESEQETRRPCFLSECPQAMSSKQTHS